MKTLTISISDLELNKFGIKKDEISFSEFVDGMVTFFAGSNLSNKSITAFRSSKLPLGHFQSSAFGRNSNT